MSARATTPHFDLPFRMAVQPGGSLTAAVVEQDSIQDIANCVEVILLTPEGWRHERPDFGSPDFAFSRVPIGSDTIRELIAEQEPRADLEITENLDLRDELSSRIEIAVARRGGAQV